MLSVPIIDAAIDRALAEDLGSGDVTTEAIVPRSMRAVARAIAKQPLVVCGGDVFARVFYRLDAGLRVERRAAEGSRAEPGDVLWVVEGAAASILSGERTALNFAQRMSGIATLAARFVAAVPAGFSLTVVDTRKTTPGLRAFERYAVRTGGAKNHRSDLGAMVLVKDNHVAIAGGVRAAIEAARARASHALRIEVEVTSLAELDEALDARADVVMLDNFRPEDVAVAVARARGRAVVEVSGGVTLERIADLARLGVDVVSVGALTHSAKAADISLELERLG
ncbi:MAG TPA: carboxylating nicotinate-nucleotide diphosphorylase [Polyangiaceae bacterium]